MVLIFGRFSTVFFGFHTEWVSFLRCHIFCQIFLCNVQVSHSCPRFPNRGTKAPTPPAKQKEHPKPGVGLEETEQWQSFVCKTSWSFRLCLFVLYLVSFRLFFHLILAKLRAEMAEIVRSKETANCVKGHMSDMSEADVSSYILCLLHICTFWAKNIHFEQIWMPKRLQYIIIGQTSSTRKIFDLRELGLL